MDIIITIVILFIVLVGLFAILRVLESGSVFRQGSRRTMRGTRGSVSEGNDEEVVESKAYRDSRPGEVHDRYTMKLRILKERHAEFYKDKDLYDASEWEELNKGYIKERKDTMESRNFEILVANELYPDEMIQYKNKGE